MSSATSYNRQLGMPARNSIPEEFFKACDVKSALHTTICIAAMIAPGVIAYRIGGVVSYLVAFLVVGIFGEALFILQHETMHGSFFSSRRMSDISGIVISAILGTRLYDGRSIHMRHHVKLGSSTQDPNLYWYDERKNPPGSAVLTFMLKQLLGAKLWPFAARTITVVLRAASIDAGVSTNTSLDQEGVGADPRKAKIDALVLVAMQVVILATISFLSALWVYFAFFFLPIVTVTAFLEAVRAFSEHVHYGDHDMPLAARQRMFFVKSKWIERAILAPYGFHYHHLHHMYPTIPVFRLKAFHDWMTIHSVGYEETYVTRKGYFSVLFRYVLSRPLE